MKNTQITRKNQTPFLVTLEDGSTRTIKPVGRDAWALQCLIAAGERGCTPIDNPAPRWSGYIHKLRKTYGLHVETITEKHGGPFAGDHARYVLRDGVELITDREAA